MTRRFASPLVALLALLASLSLFSGCNQPTSGGGGGTGVEGLTGTLVEPSGEVAAGALVRVYPVHSISLGLPKSSSTTPFPKADSTVADTAGRFAFHDVAPGVYALVATLTHDDTALALHLTQVVVQQSGTDLGTRILQQTGGVLVELRMGLTPVAGARCRVPSSPFETISDAQGHCTITGMSPGAFRIEVSGSGFQTVLTDTVIVYSGINSGVRVQLGDPSLPTAPFLLSPAPGGVTIPGDTLRWSPVQGAVFYELQVTASVDTAFDTPLIRHDSLVVTQHPLETVSPVTSYRWRVRAWNGKGSGPWATVRTYSVPSASSSPH